MKHRGKALLGRRSGPMLRKSTGSSTIEYSMNYFNGLKSFGPEGDHVAGRNGTLCPPLNPGLPAVRPFCPFLSIFTVLLSGTKLEKG